MPRIQFPRLSRIAIAAAASAAMISTAFIAPASAFAAPQVAPAAAVAPAGQADAAATQPDAPVVYNGLSPQTDPWQDNQPGGGSIDHLTVLRVNGTDVTNRAGTKASSDIDPTGIRAVSTIDPTTTRTFELVTTLTNNTTSPFVLNRGMLLPWAYSSGFGSAYSPAADASGFDEATGLKLSPSEGAPADLSFRYGVKNQPRQSWPDYRAAGHTAAELAEIYLTGTLAAGATMTLTVPLTVPGDSVATNSFTYADSVGTTPVTSYARFTVPEKDPNGKNLIPYTGKYLATVADKDADGKPVQKALPDSIQALMPAADNGVNYWVSNVAQPALKSPTSETVLYPASAQQAGGFTTIDAAPIADAVKALGYAANADAKGAYNRQVGVNAPTLVNADGSAHQASADNTAPWVGLRQVISGNDVTIPVGTGFDPVANPDMALKVFDQNGALVDLFDKSLVTFSPETINTTTPGTHQMTVGYTPDGVTRTFTITVAPKDVITVKPEPPHLRDGRWVVIPEMEGVEYQVDGETVTGEIHLTTLGELVEVTAVAKPGYQLDPTTGPTWGFTWGLPATPEKPTQSGNTVTIPDTTGVDYQVDGKTVTGELTLTKDITVTAVPKSDYYFTEDPPSWDFTFQASDKVVTATAPTQKDNVVTIPTVTGVDYLVDGKVVTGTLTIPDGTTIVVTARAQDGYVITEGATTRWTFTYNKDVPPVCDTQYFTDVTPNMQFFNDICWLKESGITTGWPDGTYRPVTPINRDAMIAYIYRMAGSPAFTPTKQTFSDVAPSTMYYREIEWAAHEGITTGWPDGTFRPVTPVARDAMAAFLYRQSGSPAVTLPASPSFSDVPAGNMYYREIEWMQHEGIANGWLDGTFRPLNDTNRDAMAAFLHRAVESGVLTLA